MQLTCLTQKLTDALHKVYRAVPTKSELPILSNVLLIAEDNLLKISATNLSTTVVTTMSANISVNGKITVPARLLREFVASIPEESLQLNLIDDILHLESEKTKSKFNGVSARDYPDLPITDENKKSIVLNTKVFSNAVARVAFCASNDDSRPVFTGIYLKFDFDTLIVVASDGYRLSELKLKIPENKGTYTVLIPAKTLLDVTKILSEEEDLELSTDSNNNLATFSQTEVFVATRTLSGTYPDYERIIPKDTKINLKVKTQEILNAVRMTSIFTKEDDSAVVLKFMTDNQIKIMARAKEKGEHESSIEFDGDLSEELKIGFNPKFLLDFLSSVKSEILKISTNGELTPCLFTTPDEENHLHVIMPIQITE